MIPVQVENIVVAVAAITIVAALVVYVWNGWRTKPK